MSETNSGDKCINCNLSAKKFSGKVKRIVTEDEAIQYQAHCDKTVTINSVFCSKCRLIIYRKHQSFESDNNSDGDNIVVDPDFHARTSSRTTEAIVELPFRSVVSTHKYCILCRRSSQLVVIPLEARLQAFTQRRIFIPKGNRCCTTHLMKKRFFTDELQLLRIHSNCTSVEISEVSLFLNKLAINVDSSLLDKIGDFSLSEEQLHTFTGLNWENMKKLEHMLISMRNSDSRTIIQALVIFLFKLRSGSSNATIQSIFDLEHVQQVSHYFHQVIDAFEKDILHTHFGINAKARDDLILQETSYMTKKLINVPQSALALILDGTYVRHEKSRNNEYQRKSYSGQKKTSLCKPFTICTTNGYIVDIAGPFNGTMNDATIMKILLQDPTGISSLLRPGDFCIVDRGFRDVAEYMKNQGYNVLMPAFKGNRAQLTSEEANTSRFITKVCWVVEAVHGAIGQKYRLLHHKMDNKLLPSLKSLCRIAGFLHNTFGKRLDSDPELADIIINFMKERRTQQNTLQELVEVQKLSRRKKPFTIMTANCLMDFPELTENDLKILFTGTYQLSQAVCYLAEIMNAEDTLNVEYLIENNNIIRMKVRSRHVNRKLYQCYIEYKSNSIGSAAIERCTCDCANGNRAVGCCSHVRQLSANAQ